MTEIKSKDELIEKAVTENNQFKNENERLKKEIRLYDCIDKWGTKECHCACRCLGNDFCDSADKKITELKAENERLVTENENLSENNEILNGINRNLEYMLDDVIAKVLTDVQEEYFYTELKEKFTTKLDEIIKDNNQYKQAIEKIKEISNRIYSEVITENWQSLLAKQILQICDEVEKD